jgi:uncharacterized protein with FMN-binding domain
VSKRNAKRLAATAAATILGTAGLVTAAYAQTMPRNEAEFEQQVGITAAQKSKINQINAKYKPQFDAINKKYRPKVEALQKQMQALQLQANNEVRPLAQKHSKEVEAVLSPAQRTKIKAIQQQAMSQRQGMMQGGGGAMQAPGR